MRIKSINYIGPDLLFPAGPDLLFQIGAGAILSKYAETMRMVSQSSILEPPQSPRIPISIHTRQTQSLSPHFVRGDMHKTNVHSWANVINALNTCVISP